MHKMTADDVAALSSLTAFFLSLAGFACALALCGAGTGGRFGFLIAEGNAAANHTVHLPTKLVVGTMVVCIDYTDVIGSTCYHSSSSTSGLHLGDIASNGDFPGATQIIATMNNPSTASIGMLHWVGWAVAIPFFVCGFSAISGSTWTGIFVLSAIVLPPLFVNALGLALDYAGVRQVAQILETLGFQSQHGTTAFNVAITSTVLAGAVIPLTIIAVIADRIHKRNESNAIVEQHSSVAIRADLEARRQARATATAAGRPDLETQHRDLFSPTRQSHLPIPRTPVVPPKPSRTASDSSDYPPSYEEESDQLYVPIVV